MNRLWLALGIYAVLALLAWFTLGDQRFRIATVVVLALFAVRTVTWSKRHPRDEAKPDE
jgi:hypothetical protein